MNKKQITGLVLVAGLLVGGFGLRAMAEEATTTPSTQTEQPARGFGGFMRGMRGHGGFGGFFGSDLTTDQQKELNLLKAEAQNIMMDYREDMTEKREALSEAIDGANKDAIIAAWDDLAALHETIEPELTTVREKITALVGSDDFPMMGSQFEDSYLAEQIEELRKVTDDAAATAIIEDLQAGCGQGRGGNGGMGRGFGRGGRMMNPGQNTDRPYRGNGL